MYKRQDIVEQKRILDSYRNAGYKAVVFECMAINPIYQNYLEKKIMHSTIGVITNIREDHMDMLGETLPEIARSLCATIPTNGHLVTAETNKELLTILEQECKARNTCLLYTSNYSLKLYVLIKTEPFYVMLGTEL